MIRRPPRSTLSSSSAASDVYKRQQFLHLPPFMGMMVGLGYLMMYGYRLKMVFSYKGDRFDVYQNVKDSEWDTLLFFFGVIFAVGGLGFIGYLQLTSAAMYQGLGPTTANVLIGVLSAIVDNIPVMFAVLQMNPDMPLYQWMLAVSYTHLTLPTKRIV